METETEAEPSNENYIDNTEEVLVYNKVVKLFNDTVSSIDDNYHIQLFVFQNVSNELLRDKLFLTNSNENIITCFIYVAGTKLQLQ